MFAAGGAYAMIDVSLTRDMEDCARLHVFIALRVFFFFFTFGGNV